MEKTKTNDPDFFHKVVDCQWACPAHTNVPEYIRLIAERRYSDAYMLNRETNVFPGILGRVCDRPCEPACRRGRIEDKPVAICRLKRVAADYKDDVTDRLPKAPAKKNGKRVALIGGGPAALTVANDLAPLGYQVTLFERETKTGGAMRSQVPGFRLPEAVLDEETENILNMGIERRFGAEVKSLKAVLGEGFDAVFVGTGAPVGRDLPLPGRKEAGDRVHVGLTFLANVAFDHLTKLEGKVLIIGGGNTAMDCCRTSLRLGGQEVRVIAPEKYEEMLASPWEKEDAEQEGIHFVNGLLPQEFVVRDGKLTGIRFQKLKQAYDSNKKWAPIPSGEPDVTLPCDHVILAIGQNTAFPWIERDIGINFDKSDRPVVDAKTFQSSLPRVFFGGDAAFGPKNIIWAVAQGHEAALSIHAFCSAKSVTERPPRGMNLLSQKMGYHDWSYANNYDDLLRRAVPHVDLKERLSALKKEVELGFDEKLALEEAARCLNCDVQTVFSETLCIECDACIDICPISCLTMADNGEEADLRLRLTAPAKNLDQALQVSGDLKTGRVMVKDEDLCIHCGLCAERCPTSAWDMQKFTLVLPKVGAI